MIFLALAIRTHRALCYRQEALGASHRRPLVSVQIISVMVLLHLAQATFTVTWLIGVMAWPPSIEARSPS